MKTSVCVSALTIALTLLAITAAPAQTVDLSKPFEVDKDTICLFHLDDLDSTEAKDAATGAKGKVVDATQVEGKFGKAMGCDGKKGWVDLSDWPKRQGSAALTVECWAKFDNKQAAANGGDLVCRGGQFMIRVAQGTAQAYFAIDGKDWRVVKGQKALAAGRWTHLAITYDPATKKASVYVDGQLDASAVPEGVTEGKLAAGYGGLRLGNHVWKQGRQCVPKGQIDEVRISSVARQYQPTSAAGANPRGEKRATATPIGSDLATPAAAESFVGPWTGNSDPSDTPKSHVQEISNGRHEYKIVQGGTMDGRNCRGPMGCGMNKEGAFIQTWESNRSVRMENVGETDIANPWLSNGRNNFRTIAEIVQSALVPGMTDAEKAFALWFQEIRYRHHSPGDNKELSEPVKVFNVYGYNTCGNDSICMGTLWKAAGFEKVAPAHAPGHCISQVFYDNGWHFYDGDLHSVYLLRDNQTVAGEQDIVRDHDLVKRTHSHGILYHAADWVGQGMCRIYFFEGEVKGDRSGRDKATMDMILRPGEALVWRWGQLRPLRYHTQLMSAAAYKSVICNGSWEYRPDLTGETWRKGATVDGVQSGPYGLTAQPGKTGTIVWQMQSPYVFVGGRLEVEGSGANFFVSLDGAKTWRPAQESLDMFFKPVDPAKYQYQLKCELESGATLKKLAIINDVQMAPLALPEMAVGENTFVYSDQTDGPRKVKITHQWVERSATNPPHVPAEALAPADGGQSDGTDITFEWAPAVDPDGDKIVDYQFELSRRPDMKLPLSMDFYKLISRTPHGSVEAGKGGKFVESELKSRKTTANAKYALPRPGLLTGGEKYYWHVRAQDEKGVWGPWSKTWSFTARGPNYPVDVTLDFDQAKGLGVLRWKPNPTGSKLLKYRVYGSDERGFTASDKAYQTKVDKDDVELAALAKFPANFIAEVTATDLAVLGNPVELSDANKTHYRVVAVDEKGNRSGPSDYATAPRPVIFSKPVAIAKVGAAYTYQLGVNRSWGHKIENRYLNFERPTFTLVKGPAWLKLDQQTGILSGTPNAAGQQDVEIRVVLQRNVRKLDEAKLIWGKLDVLSEETEQVGAATQKFTIDVTAK